MASISALSLARSSRISCSSSSSCILLSCSANRTFSCSNPSALDGAGGPDKPPSKVVNFNSKDSINSSFSNRRERASSRAFKAASRSCIALSAFSLNSCIAISRSSASVTFKRASRRNTCASSRPFWESLSASSARSARSIASCNSTWLISWASLSKSAFAAAASLCSTRAACASSMPF